MNSLKSLLILLCFSVVISVHAEQSQQGAAQPEIRTPKPPATPRVNGPAIFGVRPGSPFLYTIPATGDRPMEFSVDGLPAGLKVDAVTGRMTGTLKNAGTHTVTLRAKNALGTNEKKFKIVVGETISLTPALGWNSWNVWGPKVTADNAQSAARRRGTLGI